MNLTLLQIEPCYVMLILCLSKTAELAAALGIEETIEKYSAGLKYTCAFTLWDRTSLNIMDQARV